MWAQRAPLATSQRGAEHERLESKSSFRHWRGSGIGRQVSLRLAREGSKVGVVDLREEAAQAVVDEIHAAGGEAVAILADVTSASQVEAGVEKLVATFGRCTIWSTARALHWARAASSSAVNRPGIRPWRSM
ncbi:SDR family NAD(P)-dependent oxidoreductase [Leucobacter insecticola]|uniref:SDR family NAD(P)-dependent oxidoreductase n=1 Tax=Leucobacter insecticola TaxID=2714934 RepID=A0A6G8FH62_9MICO|nr:SDR family NAD(P)-dependent oxidoreductase [Leucobacter insecticola]